MSSLGREMRCSKEWRKKSIDRLMQLHRCALGTLYPAESESESESESIKTQKTVTGGGRVRRGRRNLQKGQVEVVELTMGPRGGAL